MAKSTVVKAVFAILLFSAGLGIFLFPSISGYINEQSQTRVISNYEEAIEALTSEDRATAYDAARSYNESLAENQAVLVDPFGESAGTGLDAEPIEEVTFLAVGDVMGYVQIPKIGIKLPIYEGASEDVLQKGIGWLRGTSLPVGGESTNTVLTGHSGLPTAKLFTDLDELEVGDEFYIRNSTEILAYRVDEKKIIDPQDAQALDIVDGKDQATLLTCYPYMVNSHRLLVIGERIPYTGQLDDVVDQGGLLDSLSSAEKDLLSSVMIVVAVALGVFLIFLVIRRKRKRAER